MALEKLYAIENLLGLKSFQLPRIPCSIPMRCHPDSLYASNVAQEWALKFMSPNATAADKKVVADAVSPLYMHLVIPIGSKKSAVTAGKLAVYALLVDDQVDEGVLEASILQDYYTAIMEHFHNPARKIPASDDHFPCQVYRATEDLVPDLRSSMFPPVYARFLSSLERYARTRFGERPRFSSIEEYMKWRRFDIFVEPCLFFIEMALESAASDADMESEDYLIVRDAAIDYVVLINDLISFAKEYALNKLLNLPVLVLLSDPDVNTFQAAVDKVYGMVIEKEKEFVYYHNILLKDAKSAGKYEFVKYLEQFPTVLSGSLQYHYSAARYHPTFFTNEKFDGNWNLSTIIDARKAGR